MNMWILGVLSSILYYFAIFAMPDYPWIFAILLVAGTIGNLISPGFVMGWIKQAKSIFSGKKMIPAISIFVIMGLNIVLAFVFKKEFICLILCIVQSIAYAFYGLFSIPGGQKVAKLTASSLV